MKEIAEKSMKEIAEKVGAERIAELKARLEAGLPLMWEPMS